MDRCPLPQLTSSIPPESDAADCAIFAFVPVFDQWQQPCVDDWHHKILELFGYFLRWTEILARLRNIQTKQMAWQAINGIRGSAELHII
jgi:hypothetical protein